MFKLIQIKVVNFYLYEARQVEVGTITGSLLEQRGDVRAWGAPPDDRRLNVL